MAALQGILDTGRAQTSRLAHKIIDATLRTNETTATTTLQNDGAGWITVRRGKESFRVEWSAQTALVKIDGAPALTLGYLEPALFVGYDGTPAYHHTGDCTDHRDYATTPR